jgi:hypothetical protein
MTFFVVCIMSIVSSVVPYAWPVSSMCAYFGICLLVFMTWICSLYQSLKMRPVCPTYLIGHLLHFSWYTPHFFICQLLGFLVLNYFYSVVCFKGYSNIGIFKWFFNHSHFRAIICEDGPFFFLPFFDFVVAFHGLLILLCWFSTVLVICCR